jgi:heat shock protein HslJ
MRNSVLLPAVLTLALLAGCGGEPETATVADAVQPDETPAASPDSARSQDPAAVVGRQWQWLGTRTPVENIEAADPSRYTLILGEDGRAQVLFDCNRGGGDYTIGEGRLEFGLLMSTRMACPEDTQDHVFMRQLEAARIFFVEDGYLYLDLFADSGTMKFGAAD